MSVKHSKRIMIKMSGIANFRKEMISELIFVTCMVFASDKRVHGFQQMISTVPKASSRSKTNFMTDYFVFDSAALRKDPLMECQHHNQRQQRTATTALYMYNLPPSGNKDSDDNKVSLLKDITTSVVAVGALVLFFLSPLGAIFFTVVNSLFAVAILLPLVGIVAFNIWQYTSTDAGSCPNCGAPVRALKDSTPSICFNCGSVVQSVDGKIYIANQNNNQGTAFADDKVMTTNDDASSSFASWLSELGNNMQSLSKEDEWDNDVMRKKNARSSTIIDVDAEVDEKK
jgi:hypothetical protein